MSHRIMLMLYLAYGSPRNLYQGMQKYVVIGLMKIYWSKPSDKIFTKSICIILWRILCMVSIKEYIIPYPTFKSSGTHWILMNI